MCVCVCVCVLQSLPASHSPPQDHSKKDSGMKDKSDPMKADKQGVTADSLEVATGDPAEDASAASDTPEDTDASGTPPADPSDTPPVDAPEEGSGTGLGDISDKPAPEPSPAAPPDAAEEM